MEETLATRRVMVTHSPGIHARPSLAIVNTVRRFKSSVRISSQDLEADASEIIQIMSLGIPQGDEVTISAQGSDAEEVLDTLVRLFAENFGFDE